MNQTKHFFAFLLIFSLFSFTCFTETWAAPSTHSKTDELEDAFKIQTETLAPPLLGSLFSPTASFEGSLSLLSSSHEPGFWGELSYESIGKNSFRLEGRDFKEPAGFFWLLKNEADLRNRWVEIIYSGPAVPSRVSVGFNSAMPRQDSDYIVPLQSSFEPKSTFLKLPDRKPFSKISRLNFYFDPKFGKNVEMALLDLRILPEGADPLARRSAADAR